MSQTKKHNQGILQTHAKSRSFKAEDFCPEANFGKGKTKIKNLSLPNTDFCL